MNSEDTKPIDQFNLDGIKEGATILIAGKRGSGKSCLIRHIIKSKDWSDATTVISPSCRLNPFHDTYVPRVHHFIPANLMEDLKTNTDQHKVIVFDDCIMSTQTRNELFNTRQSNTTLIIAQQGPQILSSEIRRAFDYVFAFNDGSGISARCLMEHYVKGFYSMVSFRKAFDQATAGNKALVVDVRMRDRNVFWFDFVDEDCNRNSVVEYEAACESDTITTPEADTTSSSCTLL